MNTPLPVPIPTVAGAAVPWYQSPVQRAQVVAMVSALVALSPKLGKLIGVNTPADAAVWVETVFGFITLVAPIVGTIWRARSKLQPLTLTQAKADVHPATIAAEKAAVAAAYPLPIPPAAAVPGVPHAANPSASILDVPFTASAKLPSGSAAGVPPRPPGPVV